ncbi:sensor domain-containing protein [Kibdelosporangium philippinense]|uniref:histidine kinase n=1 Tax=Kibdelosporangium philippinense TaxID=211113 RepID=A0ABS8Z3K4_9PSEU|nr:sensor domain-containing protein [Kibdelosporangium philippinense]MCE7002504.1 sensor domain-containing protein [Kibdelosporangium philippinense]
MDQVPGNGWQAMARGPRWFLTSAWPWKSLGYLSCSVLVAAGMLSVMDNWLSRVDSAPGYLTVVVAVLLTCFVLAMPLAGAERRRLRMVDRELADNPHVQLLFPRAGTWLLVRLGEAATWREFGYAIAFTIVLPFLDLACVLLLLIAVLLLLGPALQLIPGVEPLVVLGWQVETVADGVVVTLTGLLLLPVAAYAITVIAAGQASFARLLIAPTDAELAARVQELSRSRTRLVDAFEAERERIERDLHDGAQQRLVALTMTLGMAELELDDGPGRRLVVKARREAEGVLAELRDLIRGIHPQILTDRGIEAAVVEIADRCVIPVHVRIGLTERPASTVEAVAYFAVSEGLTNVVKHSKATRVEITARRLHNKLVLAVVDDGIGGADPKGGTGLQGLADRVAVVGGRLMLRSPQQGPTELIVELPWFVPVYA